MTTRAERLAVLVERLAKLTPKDVLFPADLAVDVTLRAARAARDQDARKSWRDRSNVWRKRWRRSQKQPAAPAAVVTAKHDFQEGWNRAVYPGRTVEAKPEGRGKVSARFHEREGGKGRACELLREAGFHARRNWARKGSRYDAPEVRGQRVTDPWVMWSKVSQCNRDLAVLPTTGGTHGGVRIAGKRCRKGRVCAHCAHVASMERGDLVLAMVEEDGGWKVGGLFVALALTHRDGPPGSEQLAHAWNRWEDPWRVLRKSDGWHACVSAGVMCLETTSGATGRTWHPHAHLLVRLRSGVTVEQFADVVAEVWGTATGTAAVRAGMASWDAAGARLGCAEWDERGDWSWNRASGWDERTKTEGWCRAVLGDDVEQRRAVHQTVKYGATTADIGTGPRMAEWVTWSRGRRLVRWLGGWDDSELRSRAEERVEREQLEREREAQRVGDAPHVGDLVPGIQAKGWAEVTASHGKPLKFVTHPEPPADWRETGEHPWAGNELHPRDVSEVRAGRAWWNARALLARWARGDLDRAAAVARDRTELLQLHGGKWNGLAEKEARKRDRAWEWSNEEQDARNEVAREIMRASVWRREGDEPGDLLKRAKRILFSLRSEKYT